MTVQTKPNIAINECIVMPKRIMQYVLKESGQQISS